LSVHVSGGANPTKPNLVAVLKSTVANSQKLKKTHPKHIQELYSLLLYPFRRMRCAAFVVENYALLRQDQDFAYLNLIS